MSEIRIDKVFIGSCTNSRIEDLRKPPPCARGRRVAGNVKLALVVPGSGLVKAQAEAKGSTASSRRRIRMARAGCSMCLAMNDDASSRRALRVDVEPQFRRRQGAGGRTHLVSPAMAAQPAIEGHFVDVRRLY
jgi:3-isopropylmalate/(R)-2-methylmalate dehydratase large subunit